MNPQLCYSLVIWLFAWGTTGVDAAMYSRNPEASSRLVAIGTVLRHLGRPAPSGSDLVAREAVYRSCGILAAVAFLTVAAVHCATAVGIWQLHGLNFWLFTLFGLAIGSRATVIRLVGPGTAQADTVEHVAAAAARITSQRRTATPQSRPRQPARGER